MSKQNKNGDKINIYDIVPTPLVKSETTGEGKIVLLKPKFKNPLLVKYLMPKMKYPYYKINLDEIGTAVWKQIDGIKNAGEIGEELEMKFGSEIHPVFERLGKFLFMLKRGRLVDF
jgi:hypothetical protein